MREALVLARCAVPHADHIFLQCMMDAKYAATVAANTDQALAGSKNDAPMYIPQAFCAVRRNGATAGKTELAKKAKALGLDAIHDTVHEMARDEARHGKAFAGLLKRYFG